MTHESLYEPCGACGKRTSRDTDHCWHCQAPMTREPPPRLRGWHVGAAVVGLLMAVGWAQPAKAPLTRQASSNASTHVQPP